MIDMMAPMAVLPSTSVATLRKSLSEGRSMLGSWAIRSAFRKSDWPPHGIGYRLDVAGGSLGLFRHMMARLGFPG
jgi:hypothetical protein